MSTFISEGTKGYTFNAFNDEDDEHENAVDVPFSALESGEFNIIYLHPEALKNKKIGSLLRSPLYQSSVCCTVIDEVHMISEW